MSGGTAEHLRRIRGRAPRALGVVLAVLGVTAAGGGPVRLGVMEFGTAGVGTDGEGLGAGLQSMITTDLANVSSLVLVERARLRDVAAELKLGRSPLVDPSTAAKLGKVVGASHLLTGTVTVAGGKMRIDARLVEVASGRVLMGETIEGQADLFFELEKALVRKLVDAVAVAVTPKERGAMAKVQTADLDAFRKYSLGLKLFDDKKYEQALKALREATDRDADFSLARTTLAEYERLVAGLRREADRIEQQRAVETERKLGKELTEEQTLITRLFDVAGRKGDAARDNRLTALYILAKHYAGGGFKLAQEEDRFAWERTADTLYQRYLAESLAAFPRFPALINHFDDQGWWRFKLPEPATFEADIQRLTGELRDFGVRGADPKSVDNARQYHRFRSLILDRKENAERLHLDVRGQADFEDRLDALLQAATGVSAQEPGARALPRRAPALAPRRRRQHQADRRAARRQGRPEVAAGAGGSDRGERTHQNPDRREREQAAARDGDAVAGPAGARRRTGA